MPRASSAATIIVVEPAGIMGAKGPTNMPFGGTPASVFRWPKEASLNYTMGAAHNFLVQDGALVPRPRLKDPLFTASNPLGTLVTGGVEVVSSVGTRFQLISGTTRLAYHSNNSFSPLSYVSSAGRSTPPSMTTQDRVDFCQIYEPTNDEMLAIASATSSYQTLFCWKSGASIFSSLTQSPSARWVAAFDNFVMAGNVRDSSGSKYGQRVQWSDRGNPFVWTPGAANLAGNQDLLDAKGTIQRIIAQEQRLVIFFDEEIWVGVRDSFPNTFRFTPLDRSRGTIFGKTCAVTPRGIMFLATDSMVYLLPKEGGPAVPVGQQIQQALREDMVNGQLNGNWAIFDEVTGTYQLYIISYLSNLDVPAMAFYMDVETGAWTRQRFENDVTGTGHQLSAGWPGALALIGSAPTWSSVSGAYTWDTYPGSWEAATATLTPQAKTAFVGSSTGSVYHMNFALGGMDAGNVPVRARWASPMLFTDTPEKQKCVTAFRVDYSTRNTDVASVLTVRFSANTGGGSLAQMGNATGIPLAPANKLPASGAVGHVYTTSQYPMFMVTTEASDLKIYRFAIVARVGGRA
jgi:hypothetical protein